MFDPQQILQSRYRLQQRLGHTATSRQTWLAVDLDADQVPVIVKLLAFNPHLHLAELKLFEREAQVLKTLDHPRIPQYCDYFCMEAQVHWLGLVQDYIPGASLQECLDRGEVFLEEEIRQLAINLLHILGYLHGREPAVLHRDIKPSNIILGDDGYSYLVDFGAVQDKAALTGVTFTVVGTCGYAPLEQFWGRAVPASDLYALGATLIHLLTGVPPADLSQRNGRLQFAELLDLCPFFAAWLQKLVEPAVEHRFASAQEALDALRTGHLSAVTPVRRIQQPEKSSIQLQRNALMLEIRIPPQVRWGSIRYRYLFHTLNVGCTGAMVLLIAIALLIPFWLHSFWLLAILGSGILLVLLVLLVLLWREQTQIRLKGDRLDIWRRSLGLTWEHREIPLDSVLGVLWQRADQLNGVSLRTEKQFINIRQGLTELECLWLVQELQDWLDHH